MPKRPCLQALALGGGDGVDPGAAGGRVAQPALRPRAVILQPGLGGDMTLPMMAITAKDLDLRGSFRFHAELAVGVALVQQAQISFAD